jgi:hypothetical protein
VRGAAHLQDRAVKKRVKGTMGRGLGVKKGWRDGKLDRRRRTPVQPESAMRGGRAEARVARSDRESLCWGVALGRGVNICREGRISPEKEFDIVSVAVWVGGRVGGELLRDR